MVVREHGGHSRSRLAAGLRLDAGAQGARSGVPGLPEARGLRRARGPDYRIHCYTTWDTPEQLEAFLERGYTFERMLGDVAGIQAEPPHLMEKIF